MANENIKFRVSEELLREFEDYNRQVVKFNNIEEARNFVFQIWPRIKASEKEIIAVNPKYWDRLVRLLAINEILIMMMLSDNDVIEIFQKDIIWYFRDMMENIDLWEKVRGKLITIFDYVARDEFKEKIKKALLVNIEFITENKIIRNDTDYPPTIKDWLLDYTSVIGNGKADAIKMNEYFIQSRNFQTLSEKSKIAIRTLLNLFEKIKRTSQDPDGIEESVDIIEDGEKKILGDGTFQGYDQRVVDLVKKFEAAGLIEPEEKELVAGQIVPAAVSGSEDSTQIVLAYRGDAKFANTIKQAEAKLARATGGDKMKLRDEFFNAVQLKNIANAVAAFRLLAQGNDLMNFMAGDARLNKFLLSVWTKKYGPAFVKEFSAKPAEPKFVRAFLQYVLQERLNMSESDAARIGAQLGNILVNAGAAKYEQMAYFDVAGKRFKWFE